MDTYTMNSSDTLSLQFTRDEIFMLLMALANAHIDLGAHEQPLCEKVRNAWDLLRTLPQEGVSESLAAAGLR